MTIVRHSQSFIWAAVAAGAAGAPHAHGLIQPDPAADELERRLAEDVAPIMARYCYRCHGQSKQENGVAFEGIASMGDVLEWADDWSIAREMLSSRSMPPEDESQPTDHESLIVTQWISDALAYYPPDAPVDPGWFTIHRLNKAEYRNTLRDLLGADPALVDLTKDLPPDDTGYGFDNIADVLSMSPLQLEGYLDAAERALEIGLGPVAEVSTEPRLLRMRAPEGAGRELDRGGVMLFSNGAAVGLYEAPADAEYEIVITAWSQKGGADEANMRLRVDGKELGSFDVAAGRNEPGQYRVRTRLARGTRQVAAAFTNDYWVPDVADRNLAVVDVTVAGPLSSQSIARGPAFDEVFFSAPPDGASEQARHAAARRIIERFASRAWRRSVRPDELTPLNRLYLESRRAGDGFEQGVRVELTAALISPNFLYRTVNNYDADDPSVVYELSDEELGSRLSYFLWSSMPDDELMSLARRGELRDPETLRTQARRMLADPRADALIENFAGQWLLLRNLNTLQIDTQTFPAYSALLRDDMIREATLFFGDVVRSDRPVTDLIDADHTFINERLARLYRIDGVQGDEFRRVELPADSPRGGVLTMGAVLTVTSNPTRTSPVKRGHWVLDQLLGTPPPPPPADVPPLEQAARQLSPDATFREQLSAHLTNATCASCHRRMDPIGLAMEHFDAIGAWRDEAYGGPIDATGELPGGERFEGAEQLKQILLARERALTENLARKVLTYALGRGMEPFDRPTIQRIADHVEAKGGRFGALIDALVTSDAFRTCRGRK